MNEQNPAGNAPSPQQSNAPAPDVAARKRRLGRGLGGLLGVRSPVNEGQPTEATPTASAEQQENTATKNTATQNTDGLDVRMLPVSRVKRNPNQPRKHFPKDAQKELADSLIAHGVLQPLIVREFGESFQLVAGERRWLAAQQAGLETIPCRVVDVVDKTACEFAFEENLKRQDLNDLEKAQAFKEYLDTFDSTVEELGRQLSMSRSAVSNTLRLLDLPVPIKNALQERKMTAGHARALLSLGVEDQLRLANTIQNQGWSVRKTETEVRELIKAAQSTTDDANGEQETATLPIDTSDQTPEEKSNHLRSLESQLRDLLGTKVEIKQKGKEAGRIIIDFSSHDQFESILERLQESHSRAA